MELPGGPATVPPVFRRPLTTIRFVSPGIGRGYKVNLSR